MVLSLLSSTQTSACSCTTFLSNHLDDQIYLQNIEKWTVRVKGGMSLWHGMWHDLRNGIIIRNVILAEWLFDINYTKKRAIFLREAALLNTAGLNMMKIDRR